MMYEDDPTRDELDEVEDLLAIRQHSPTFWDADAGELVAADPFEHPSWGVVDAFAEGWDDPAEAVEIREQLAQEHQLLPLADTPTARPAVHPLALVPVAPDGYWPAADDYESGVAA